MNHKNLDKLITYFAALLVVLFVSIPLIWSLISSLKPNSEILKYPPTFFPTRIVFDQYINLIKTTKFLQYFVNSVIVGTISTFLTLLIATPAAYSLTRFNYRRKNVITALLLFSYMVPLLLLGLPLFVIMTILNLINTRLSLVIAYVAFSLPFSMWMLRINSYTRELLKDGDENKKGDEIVCLCRD